MRVLDFGIAKALSLSRRLTRNEFGSVPYASPERLDAGEVNALSDLWSLAVMLYEMVTGLQPYHAETTERLERMIRSRIPPPPAPDPCPEPLRRILIKAMAPDPDVRYQSAREFADDLAAFRQGDAGARRGRRPGRHAAHRSARADAATTRRAAPRPGETPRGADATTALPRRGSASGTPQTPQRSPAAACAFGDTMRVAGAAGAGRRAVRRLGRDLELSCSTSTGSNWSARSKPSS